jgi:hypothetical protein
MDDEEQKDAIVGNLKEMIKGISKRRVKGHCERQNRVILPKSLNGASKHSPMNGVLAETLSTPISLNQESLTEDTIDSGGARAAVSRLARIPRFG